MRRSALLAGFLLLSVFGQERFSVKRSGAAMGTELLMEAQGTDTNQLQRALDAAWAEMERVEDMMTTWRDSPLTRLNAASGLGPQAVPAELAGIVNRAKELHAVSEGAFDVSFYSVGKLWDFKAKPPVLPNADAIEAALLKVGAQGIEVDTSPAAPRITLPPGTRIGLGGIAKGYGVDRAMKVLRGLGVEHGIVNAGGDMKALGNNMGEPWEVAVKHPRDRERALAAIKLRNQCIVTSGDYERFFEHEGKRYHHILDPRTGYPASGCMSVSVITFNAEFADALATACCVLGPEKGKALLEQLPKVEGILVGMDGEVVATSGLR